MKDRFNLRLYSEKRHEYVYINTIGYEDGKISYIDILDPSNELYAIEISVNDLGKDYVLERCSGLKDKNGKLIYEGDIVYVDEYVYYSEPLTLVIAFHNGAFLAGDRYIDNNSVHMKIIGNIHENPELLEGKNE